MRDGQAPFSSRELAVPRFQQPDDVTCGPTCLAQVFEYYDDAYDIGELAKITPRNPDGGTLAVYLGQVALARGYRATLYPFTLRIFDPTWADCNQRQLVRKLGQRAAWVRHPKLKRATLAYRDFAVAGGRIEFAELSPELLTRILDRGHPIVSGLSATYLYRTPRERPHSNEDDDIRGEPVGHFVVICGYQRDALSFSVSDPSPHAPFSKQGRYTVTTQRLINSILLGDVTYDAVLLEIAPRRRTGAPWASKRR